MDARDLGFQLGYNAAYLVAWGGGLGLPVLALAWIVKRLRRC
jgi:hypothetical protein